MPQIKDGDKVKVHYTAKFDDGKTYQSTEGRDPEEFHLADGEIIDGIKFNLIGMEPGQKKSFTVGPEQGYGAHNSDLLAEVDRKQLPDELTPFLGQQLVMERDTGEEVTVVITGLTDDTMTIDANHPLAGKTLNFDVEIIEIN